MTTAKRAIRTFKPFSLTALSLLMLAQTAWTAGYKVEFNSSSVLADGGGAAVVEDASTNWYNAAGLVDLPLQVVGSVINVYAPTTFHGTVIAPSTLSFFPTTAPFANNFIASGSASSHPDNFLPAMHISIPMTPNCLALGFSYLPAWGFTEDYGNSSLVRYNLDDVYTKSVDLSASLAWRINRWWSVGLGPDANYFSVQSRVNVRTESILPGVVPTAGDSLTRFTGSDWAYGGHIGVLLRLNDATRIGLNYRSKFMTHLKGYSSFALNNLAWFESNIFRLAIALPPTWMLSFYRDINPCWAIMGTIAYDEWGSIQNYHATGYIQPPTPVNPVPTVRNVDLPQNFHNTVDASIGVHYTLNPSWLFRASFKYVDTPTTSGFRYVNFPDAPKYGVQVGARWRLNRKVTFDFIYGHVFTRSIHTQDINPLSGAVAFGHNNTSVDFLGGQMVWNIC